MNFFYTAVTAITCFVLVVLHFLVMENDRIEKADKNKFYMTYAFIAAGALCGYVSVALNGAPSSYTAVHSLVKSLHYALAPAAGIFFVEQVVEEDRVLRFAKWLVIANGILSFLSNFTGWYFYIDEANIFQSGPLLLIYVIVYIFIIGLAMNGFLLYARRFAHRHYASIFAIWIFMFVFIVLQEISNDAVRVNFLVFSISCVMIYAHYCQYRLQESTATITLQQNMLERDALTKLYNRYSYIHTLEDYEKQGPAPSGLIAVSIDINGLKHVNDSLGHQAGDDLICGAAQVIRDTFNSYGKCFRTGGDEFIVLLNMPEDENAALRCKELIASLQETAASWKGRFVSSVSLSCGFAAASAHADASVEKLVSIADAYMYEMKEAYYQANGTHR